MIIKKQGETFEYEGKKYIVGEDIYATESSYSGLIGIIKEIRTDKDMETDNSEPEIYCDFYEPILQADKRRLQEKFGTELYALDGIIMAPSMITPIREGCCNGEEKYGKIFLLQEDWNFDGDGLQSNSTAFTNKQSAMMFLRYKLYQESEDGSIASYEDKDEVMVDEGQDWYEIYLEGYYNDDHYNIQIIELPLPMSESYFKRMILEMMPIERRSHIIDQLEQWSETLQLTNEQYSAVINDPMLSTLIGKKLADNDEYWKIYWRAVAEVASELIAKHTKKENGDD